MSYIFPVAYMSVSYSITALLVAFGLFGNIELAADIGIIHGATLATFHAFSANARNLILRDSGEALQDEILGLRVLLFIPLALCAYLLASSFTEINIVLAVAIISRRCCEWISEIHLCLLENQADTKHSLEFFLVQGVLFILLVVVGPIANMSWFYPTLFLWAISPLLLSVKFFRHRFTMPFNRVLSVIPRHLPHFGSTVIIGISLYAFRILLMIFAGKVAAGELYTSFSIGGFMGSFFANIMGPSIILYQVSQKKSRYPVPIRAAIAGLSLVSAILIYLVIFKQGELVLLTGHSIFFWQAISLSMVGGLVMIKAQEIRIRLLQLYKEGDVFGPDLMVHLLLVTSIPAFFLVGGVSFFPALSLLNALVAILFYWSAEKDVNQKSWSGRYFHKHHQPILFTIIFLIALPIFFQLSGRIFSSRLPVFDSGGHITALPIPFSVLSCYIGIFVLAKYKEAILSLSLVFSVFLLMFISSIISTSGEIHQEQGKLLLFLQFLLPYPALMLGQIFESHSKNDVLIPKAFIFVLLAVVPAQLISTWVNGRLILWHDLYIFSIYQHWQYVPLIFVSMFLYAFFCLWSSSEYRKTLCFLSVLMSFYASASLSMLTVFACWVGFSCAALYFYMKDKEPKIIGLAALSLAASFCYFYYMKNTAVLALSQKVDLVNVTDRFDGWIFYRSAIIDNIGTFLVGHARPPAREVITSAHNYYLDFIYNFGFISIIPIICFMFYTVALIFKNIREVFRSSGGVALAAIVLYLVLIDNNFKVSLRQPYPGIFTFFMWGVLISKLKIINFRRVS